MTNLTGSQFCEKCPVVVFDKEKVGQAAMAGSRENKNLQYVIAGIVDLDAIPEEKQRLEIGTDENPIPLIRFLPELNTNTIIAEKKPGRNEPCICGSGLKYKKCCGKV
ncbi:MAG: SEC-C metal-binding domain-containing protein [Bacteroidales bacterium]